MSRSFKLAAALAAAALATACTQTVTLAPAGVYALGSYSVELQRDWSHIPAGLDRAVRVDQLTVDGPLLNRVYVIDQLEDGASMVATRKEDDPAPVFRAGMSELDLVEFVIDSLSDLGLENLQTSQVRPAPFAGADGVWFEFDAAYASGLSIRGRTAASVSQGALNAMIFLAPEQHYFAASSAEVDAMFQSARRQAIG